MYALLAFFVFYKAYTKNVTFPVIKGDGFYFNLNINGVSHLVGLSTSIGVSIATDIGSTETVQRWDDDSIFYTNDINQGKFYSTKVNIQNQDLKMTFADIAKNINIISFPFEEDYYHESFSKKLLKAKLIDSTDFGLVKDDSNFDLVIGDITYNTTDDNIVSCEVFDDYDRGKSHWGCKAKYIIITNNVAAVGNKTNDDYISVEIEAIIDPIIPFGAIFPEKYKSEINSLLCDESREINSTTFELLGETFANQTCVAKRSNTSISLVMNGYVHEVIPRGEASEPLITLYYTSKNKIFIGSEYLKKLSSIMFSFSFSKIFFKPNNPLINIRALTKDSKARSALFYVGAIFGLVLLILLAILIPYFFYWRSRRKLQDRLNYEIIYRKVADTKENLLTLN